MCNQEGHKILMTLGVYLVGYGHMAIHESGSGTSTHGLTRGNTHHVSMDLDLPTVTDRIWDSLTSMDGSSSIWSAVRSDSQTKGLNHVLGQFSGKCGGYSLFHRLSVG